MEFLDQMLRTKFLIALVGCVTLAACSKPIQVEGEVFLDSSSRNSPTPLRGVQVYFFTEKQYLSLRKHIDDWRIWRPIDNGNWDNKFPANFEPYTRNHDFAELTQDVISVVSDSSGKFQVSLRTGKKYWVWCSGSSTRERGAYTTRPWLFQFVTNGSKLVLSEVNRVPETAE